MRSLPFGMLLAGCSGLDEGPIGVNEVAPHATAGVTDEAGEPADWLELLNDDTVPRDLDGWTLTLVGDDGPADAFVFPAGTRLAPGELRLAWGDGMADQGPLHTFAFPAGAFEIDVTDASGVRVQEIHVPDLGPGQSFGRVPDDEPNWQVIDHASPLERNGTP
jgi:hypothetical protein